MIKSLRIKFVAVNMSIVTLMLCLMFGLVYQFTARSMELESLRMMEQIAAEPFRIGRPDEHFSGSRLPYFVLHVGLHGEVIATGGGYYDLSDETFLREVTLAVLDDQQNSGILKDYQLRFCRRELPRGELFVFADISSEQRTLQHLLQTFAVIGGVSFFVFLAISIQLSRWAAKPIEQAWKQQKQFVADASHELKTPLTVIAANAELLQNEDCSESERRQFSGSILTMTGQMRSLVEQMLELARSDLEQRKAVPERIDLSSLAEDQVISYEGVFADQGLSLESEIQPDLTVMGDRQELGQLLDILLDNAQKYAAPDSTSVVTLTSAQRNRCRLAVSNRGETIPKEKLDKLFQRFYRLDEARHRSGSFGLGLSIAQNIVQRHRGKLWAESRDGVNTFFVELPLSSKRTS